MLKPLNEVIQEIEWDMLLDEAQPQYKAQYIDFTVTISPAPQFETIYFTYLDEEEVFGGFFSMTYGCFMQETIECNTVEFVENAILENLDIIDVGAY